MGNGIEVHLAISATTKQSDIQEIIHQFEPFKYRSIIITKLDETGRIGNLISALYEYRKPVSFITDGQRVPQDIEQAEKIRMLMTLEGFKVNREKLEEKMV
jgi:flagellar biosynthesis protein FlhF